VRRILKELAAETSGPGRKALLAWLEELPEARLSTIHSFCASLLRSHAVEAGLDPSFAVCAETDLADRLLTEAADETLLAAVEEEDPAALGLLTSFPFDRLVEILCRLVSLRGVCDFAEYADPSATMDRWRRRVEEEAKAAWGELAEDRPFLDMLAEVQAAVCTDPADKLRLVRDTAVATIRGLLTRAADRTAETIAALAKAGNVGRKGSWDLPLADLRGKIGTLIDIVRDHKVYTESLGSADQAAAEALAALTALAGRAEQRYARTKRARGMLDFDDLIFHAHRLIGSRPDVRKAVGESIDQLLVDECQDTDAVQLSLLRGLLGGEADALPPEGRLFVVGDAKQSIYRFRGAQVEVFEELCRELGEPRQENLNTSFRTHEAGVEFVNHLFGRLMGKDFEPIQADRKTPPPGESVEILLAGRGGGQDIADIHQATLAQADVVADRIDRMLAGGEKIVWDRQGHGWRAVRPGDIAVLFSRMTHSLAYERALQGRSLPYYVVGGVGFFRQQEVYDLTNALRVIDNPMADVPFFGVLRSSLFGLDDNALMRIARHGRRPYLPNLLGDGVQAPPGLPEHQRKALRCAGELLSALHARKDAVGIDALLEDLLAATGYEACMMAAPQGRRIVGNIRQLVDRARAASAQGTALADFIAEIEELILSETRQEQAAVAGEEDDVVRLMTIHRAKGLEFPVVFLPDLNAGMRASHDPLTRRHGWPLVLKVQAGDQDAPGVDPVAYRVCTEREKQDARKEDLRKFYVAVTRHQDHLVLVGADWRTQEGFFHGTDSFLARVDEVLDIRRALDEGATTVPYGQRFAAAVRRAVPDPRAPAPPARKHGQKLLAEAADGDELARGILAAAAPKAAPLPLLGPLPAGAYPVEIAVTALGEFAHCPALYRWRHELRMPAAERRADSPMPPKGPPAASMDAATLGTLYHRCLERLDFRKPQPEIGRAHV